MDYKGEWGGGGPGHSWAQMARASAISRKQAQNARFLWLNTIVSGLFHENAGL